MPHVGAALTVTTHPHISIKSEPVSPSRERSPAPPPPAVFPATRPEPGDSLSSPAGASYETGDRDDGRGDFGPTLGLLRPAPEPEAEGSAVKRMRLDTWVYCSIAPPVCHCLLHPGTGPYAPSLSHLPPKRWPASPSISPYGAARTPFHPRQRPISPPSSISPSAR